MKDSLSSVMNWYETVSETQLLARKHLKSTEKIARGSKFVYLSSEEIFEEMKSVKIELDDLAVFSLVSVFESIILDYLNQVVKNTKTEKGSSFEKGYVNILKCNRNDGDF
ncbi:hypothetical protein [Bacillus sp. FSL K6-3431]|uniref:hypothetical protein n=1 Tax=Bacillus sp. FSL K6-3431 TaxID=2921500 RepID=UPI0030FA02FA